MDESAHNSFRAAARAHRKRRAGHRQRRQSAKRFAADIGARCAHESDSLCEEAARDEHENLRRTRIEPLRIVYHAQERVLLGDLPQQGQRRERESRDRGTLRRDASTQRREPGDARFSFPPL
jgi:hypothetical protein